MTAKSWKAKVSFSTKDRNERPSIIVQVSEELTAQVGKHNSHNSLMCTVCCRLP